MTTPASNTMRPRLLAADPRVWLLAISFALALTYGLVGQRLREIGAPLDLVALQKALGVVLLAALALLARAPRLIVWALVFGAAGDFLLARARLPEGVLAFALGHLCYIRAFLSDGIGLRAALTRPARLGACAAIAASAILSTAILAPQTSALFAPLCAYTAILAAMTMTSFTLPWRNWPAMLGAVLFFVSDGFTAASLFHQPAEPALKFVVNLGGWIIYWAGQAAIAWGMSTLRPTR